MRAAEPPAPTLAVGLADDLWAIVTISTLWAAIGVVVARRHARRGHDGRALAAMGLLFGPLLIGFARTSLRQHERESRPVEILRAGPRTEGPRVVVGLLGRPESAADALSIMRMFQDKTTIELARPVMYDTVRADDTDPHRQRAVRELQDAALFLHEFDTDLLLVPGTGAPAIRRFAEAGDADLVLLVGEDPSTKTAKRQREGNGRTPTVNLDADTSARDSSSR